MKIIFLTIAIALFSSVSLGQSDLPIIGNISDLTGKKKVYLSAETTDSRKLIQKVIEKEKKLEIVGDPKDADFILEFKQIRKTQPTGGLIKSGYQEDIGEMTAYFFNPDKKKVVAWSKTKNVYDGKTWGIPPKNETALTKELLKLLSEQK